MSARLWDELAHATFVQGLLLELFFLAADGSPEEAVLLKAGTAQDLRVLALEQAYEACR
ncbi:hypothetical protein [Variovorax guangxiensis]|uniref:hypothetical protein n=1 Tax=Variovorax guangxiensis TaxID=1775474 RepID=UPI001404F495|nr:hypothetical protein [Variovorax guangxiensis]